MTDIKVLEPRLFYRDSETGQLFLRDKYFNGSGKDLFKDVPLSTHMDAGVSTGLLYGGEVTVNTDNTKFDVAAGTGVIVDDTDPNDLKIYDVQWDAHIAVTPTYLATAATTFLFIDRNGQVVQSLSFPTSPDIRDKIQIGSIVHGNNVNLSGTSDFLSAPPYNYAASLTDLIVALGVINVSGNEFNGDPAGNLKFHKTAGTMFYFGIDGKSDPTDPNNISTPELTAPNVIFTWRDGSGDFNTAFTDAITAGVYDDNTGGASAPTGTMSTNQWANHRVRYSPDANQMVVQYGQVKYNSDSAAIAAISSEDYTPDPEFSGVPLRAILTMRGAAVDLSDIGDAVFTNLNRLGLI